MENYSLPDWFGLCQLSERFPGWGSLEDIANTPTICLAAGQSYLEAIARAEELGRKTPSKSS